MLFWSGQSLSSLGDALAAVAFPLLVLEATGSVVGMGLLTGTFAASRLLAGFFSGTIVDRVDRRRLMIACDLVRMALYATIPLVFYLWKPVPWLLYLVAALGGAVGNFFEVGYISAVASLVERDQLVDANGRLQATLSLSQVIGPALAGLISARGGPALALAADALTFLVSALSLWVITLRRSAAAQATVSAEGRAHPAFGREFLAGVRYLIAHPVLRALTLLIAGLAFLMSAVVDLFIYQVKHELGHGDRTVGLLMGVVTSGGIAAALLAPRLRRRYGLGTPWLAALSLQGLALLVMGLWPGLGIATGMAALVVGGTTLRGTITMSYRQAVVPEHLLGRVTSAFWTLIAVPAPLGAVVLTGLAQRIGAPRVLFGVGLCALALALVGRRTALRSAADPV